MHSPRLRSTLAALSFVFVSALTFATAVGPSPSPRPVATSPLSASMPEDAMQFFKDKGFGGRMFQISDVTANPSWRNHQFEGKKEDQISSRRWNPTMAPPNQMATALDAPPPGPVI